MADENKMQLAHKVFQCLCDSLESKGWKFYKDAERLVVHFGVTGKEITTQLIFFIDAERELVRLLAPLKTQMAENKRIEGAVATCVASSGLPNGNFDYDLKKGSIVFRLGSSYKGRELNGDVFHYMISYAFAMVEQYHNRFVALNDGTINIADFIDNK